MNYYFPGLLDRDVLSKEKLGNVAFPYSHHLNSGENALRLVLRSFNLKPLTKVAIPAFVCNSVSNAVINEGLTPVLFDLKNDNSFWTEYSIDRIINEKIEVVLIAHLYGFIHPDTFAIVDFCSKNNLKVLHDAAQSYGIDKNKISGITVYSFGPGKSTTAGGGAVIEGLKDEKIYQNSVKSYSSLQNYWVNVNANFFLKSRIYGYTFNWLTLFLKKNVERIVDKLKLKSDLYPMTTFQKIFAMEAIRLVSIKKEDRALRYEILKNSVKNNPVVFAACDDVNIAGFKIVFYVKDRIEGFQKYLVNNEIPFFRLFEEQIAVLDTNFVFKQNANRFFELSCEASIPMDEINRIATLLKNYK